MLDNSLIGKRIHERRVQTGISVITIAEITGLTRSTIYKYERGEIKKIKLAVIESIANCLHCNPSWLIGISDDKYLSKPSKFVRDDVDTSKILDDILSYISETEYLKYNGLDLTPSAKKIIIVNLTETKKKIDHLYGFDE